MLRLLAIPALILTVRSAGAQITPVGTDETFDVATWNVEWFGHPNSGPADDATQVANVADIILGSSIDIWALQEITNDQRFEELLGLLGSDWAGTIATTSSNGTQRIAYIYDTRVVQRRVTAHILESESHAFAGRPPLKAQFIVTLPGITHTVTLINVHMKAFADASSYDRRVLAATRVKTHIDFTGLASEQVIFLGDFNDELEESTFARQPSPYEPFLSDPSNYSALTLPIEQAGLPTFIGGFGGTIDHIIASSEMAEFYVQGSTRRLDNLLTVNGFAARTSDHLPVVASFDATTNVNSERPPIEAPFTVSVVPHPVQGGRGRLTFDSPTRFPLVFELYSMTGRRVLRNRIPPGTKDADLGLSNLAAGLYAIRLSGGEGALTKVIVVH